MIRELLPAKLVNPDDSVSDCFVSFLAITQLFASITEGNKSVAMPFYSGKIPLNTQDKNIVLSVISADKNKELMYVCGTVAADFSTEDSSLVDSQPRFFTQIKENITITYVSSPKSLKP